VSGPDLPLFVRLVVDSSALRTANGATDFSPLDERVHLYKKLNVRVLLVLADLTLSAADVDGWRQFVRALAERYRGEVFGYQIGLAVDSDSGPARSSARTYAYYLKLASVQIRSVDPRAFVAQGVGPADDSEWQSELYREDVAPYVDGVPVSGAALGPSASADVERRFEAVRSVVEDQDPAAAMMVTGVELENERDAARRWLVAQFSFTDTKWTLRTFVGSTGAIASVLKTASVLKDMVAGEVVTLDERSVALKLTLDGRDVTSALPHRMLYNLSNFSTYVVYWGLDAASGSLQVELIDQVGRAPAVRDAIVGRVTRPEAFTWDPVTKRSRVGAPLAAHPTVLDFNYGGAEVFVDRVDVANKVSLTVAEIIFRHQQAQVAQDALYHNFVASARMEQHFRPSPTDAVDVVSENRFYFDREGVEWEELSFSVNGAKWGADRPSFPLLQAEKVLSLPLDLRLNADYRYTLEGIERVGNRLCYLVSFAPLDNAQSLYRGRVWIDEERFVRLKVQAVQTRMNAPVVSNEEIQLFEPVAHVQNQPLYLFSRLTSRQIFLIAGRNLLVEKEVRFSDFHVNASNFAELRGTARAGDRIMYRDTDEGLRYFVKRGNERIISEQLTTSAKALAIGTTVDPSFDFPLPILGLNYLDFDFLGKDTQLAVLFGGVLALGNVQKPKLGRTPFDASVDFFAIAVPVNDQVFDETGERRDERVRSIPFSTGLNVGYQFTSFQKISAGYVFRYDAYFRDTMAAENFIAPPRTATNGLGLAYEFKRAGYSFSASATAFRRTAWRAWGRNASEFDPAHRSYRRYTVSLSKDFYPGAFQKIHLNGAWFGGEHLDRFSMYQFGLFDETRMHGVPGAGVRFGELGMLRSSYSFNVFEQYRFDAFVDQAFGQDPRDRGSWVPVTGTGFAINLRAPWNTMLRADVGKSFLPRIYSRSGSVVVQILILKPL